MSDPKTLVIREDCNGRKYPTYVDSSTAEARIAILEQQLTAEREARERAEALARDYDEVHKDHKRLVSEIDVILNGEEGAAKQASLCDVMGQIKEMKQRAESAEQRIREAREQEPVMWIEAEKSASNENVRNVIGSMLYSTRVHAAEPTTGNPVWPLYAAPIPPADVAELQRELSNVEIELDAMNDNFQAMLKDRNKYKNENAELTRKLAEQQAVFKKIQYLMGISNNTCESFQYSEEELTKLLEEAKRQAVPEGWQLVPKHSPIVKIELWDGKFWQPEGSANYNRMLEAMLSAAPQPSGVDK